MNYLFLLPLIKSDLLFQPYKINIIAILQIIALTGRNWCKFDCLLATVSDQRSPAASHKGNLNCHVKSVHNEKGN